jgi:type I restriction enzyme S subunit
VRDQSGHWIKARLDEVCSLITDGTHHSPPNADAGDFMYVTAKNIRPWGLDIRDITFVDRGRHDEIYARCPVTRGDVLYIKDGVTAGLAAVNRLDEPFSMLSSVALLRPIEEALDPEFLKHWLNSPETFTRMTGGMTGSAIRRIILKQIRTAELLLPPFNEQRRIAAKLDATLAAVDACRQRLDGVAVILKRFRQAVLAAATSGEFTREWREERDRDHPMEETTLGEVILEMRNGLSPKPAMNPPGVKILRIGAVRSGLIDWEDHRYLNLPAKEVLALELRLDDLLFTRYNGTLEFVGVCARVGEICGQYIYPDKLIRARCDPEKVLPAYIELAFGAHSVRSQVESLVKSSAGQKGISGGDLKGIRFSLPPIDEQQEIVRRAQELFTLADQLEARLNAARAIVDRLIPALLAKAFRGELVPQDPNDEPASVLLERIRAARQAEAGVGKPSRRGRRKAAANQDQLPLDAAPVPPDLLTRLLQECGALSERALLAASELEPGRFRRQLELEMRLGAVQETRDDGQVLLEAVG